MVLIFEGADLVGKTTLARHYVQGLGFPIVKADVEQSCAELDRVLALGPAVPRDLPTGGSSMSGSRLASFRSTSPSLADLLGAGGGTRTPAT
jgi:hypothetical protein